MTDPTPCAVDPCRAVLIQGESLICSDCLEAVTPLILAAVEAQKERDARLAEAPRRIMPLYGESIADTAAFTQRCIAAAIRGNAE